MNTKRKPQLERFLSQLQKTNATLAFFSDFEKIGQHVANISISLNMLNYLLGKEDLRQAVEQLWQRDPTAFDVMDILIATRKAEQRLFVDHTGRTRKVHSLFGSVDGIMEFLEGTGLAEVFRKREVKNLVDYVFGVETGLDTNSRKNRSGTTTENLVANILQTHGIAFEQQVSSHQFPALATALGVDQKVFDFCIKTPQKVFLIEVNFYNGGGSKPNEVARAYTDLAPKINSVPGYEFVWITDGQGWQTAKNKLEEAFKAIPRIYNFTTLPNFIRELQSC